VGAVGSNGFEPSVRVPAHQFSSQAIVTGPYNQGELQPDGTWTAAKDTYYLIADGDTLYRLDESLAMSKVFVDPAHEPIWGFGVIKAPPEPGKEAALLPMVRTLSAVTILSGMSQAHAVVRYNTAGGTVLAESGSVSAGYLAQQDAFLFEVYRMSKPGEWIETAQVVHRDGTPEPEMVLPPTHSSYIGPRLPFAEQYVFPSVTPPAVTGVSMALSYVAQGSSAHYVLESKLRGIGWAVAVSVIAAAAAFELGRRRYRSVKAGLAWAVGGLVGGLFGLWALLATAPRIPVEKCPHCGQPRRADAPTCPHCHTPPAGPARNGTEVFGEVATMSAK